MFSRAFGRSKYRSSLHISLLVGIVNHGGCVVVLLHFVAFMNAYFSFFPKDFWWGLVWSCGLYFVVGTSDSQCRIGHFHAPFTRSYVEKHIEYGAAECANFSEIWTSGKSKFFICSSHKSIVVLGESPYCCKSILFLGKSFCSHKSILFLGESPCCSSHPKKRKRFFYW